MSLDQIPLEIASIFLGGVGKYTLYLVKLQVIITYLQRSLLFFFLISIFAPVWDKRYDIRIIISACRRIK